MDANPSASPAEKEVVTDLKAAVEARRELGAELEDHVLEAFLARVQQRIDTQVAEKLAVSGARPVAGQQRGYMPGWVLPASLILSFPLLGIAGKYAGGFGILIVMIALVSLTAIWLDYSKR